MGRGGLYAAGAEAERQRRRIGERASPGGPYSGSYIDLTVRDGEIVRASDWIYAEEFGPQMWSPFFRWLDTTYGPEDGNIMWTGNGLGLSEESIALWEKHSQEYVEHVAQGTEGAETAP